jgi:hypothetical protein
MPTSNTAKRPNHPYGTDSNGFAHHRLDDIPKLSGHRGHTEKPW